jgi:hypothetical protein
VPNPLRYFDNLLPKFVVYGPTYNVISLFSKLLIRVRPLDKTSYIVNHLYQFHVTIEPQEIIDIRKEVTSHDAKQKITILINKA